VEILFGLLVAGLGLLTSLFALSMKRQDFSWLEASAGLFLFVLGGYLTLAGPSESFVPVGQRINCHGRSWIR
jgi:hypothetical protein